MDNIINKLFNNNKFNERALRKLNEEERKIIFNNANIKTDNLVEAIYWIKNNLITYPKICVCGKPITKFTSFNQGYSPNYCSRKCSNNSDITKKNRIKTSIEKYGTEFPWQNKIIKDKIRKNSLNSWWNSDRFSRFTDYKLLTTIEEYNNVKSTKLIWKCKKCELEFETWANNGIISPECPSCFHHKTSSKEHREILNFIKEIYKKQIKVNDKTEIYPYELDIFLPQLNIAIEFHGLYWHSFSRLETFNEKRKHLDKLNICEEKEIKLIQIFENEWKHKRDIVKSRLKSIIGINERIYARNCEIKEIDNEISNKFLNENHIQGQCSSKIKIGLYNKNELVSVMTFGKPRFNKKYEWELIRFCSNKNVIGGANKLLNHFIKMCHPQNIISYVDRRWSNGNLYNKLNFKLSHSTEPNYFYFKNSNILESRLKYQKSKLKNILGEKFNKNLSEAENMFNNGYRRIWDCGNLVYVWEKK